MADIAARIENIIAAPVTHLGYNLVRVAMIGTAKRPTLQIMAERADRAAMTVDDCEAISRHLSALLDVEDPIAARYSLEVSSPGIDRPLTRPDDYERFKGHLATVEVKIPLDQGEDKPARKRFQGKVAGFENGEIVLIGDIQEFRLAFDNIAKAKLVLTDELIKAGISN